MLTLMHDLIVAYSQVRSSFLSFADGGSDVLGINYRFRQSVAINKLLTIGH